MNSIDLFKRNECVAYDAVTCHYLIYDTQLHYNLLLSRSLWLLSASFIPSFISICVAGRQEHNSASAVYEENSESIR